jgi:hypothetical protein
MAHGVFQIQKPVGDEEGVLGAFASYTLRLK